MRTLRAIMWLRWRLLMGSLRGGQRRDSMEMVSRALAAVIPIAFVALSFGSVVAVCVLGFLGGRAIATGLVEAALMVVIVRLTMVVMLGLVVVITVASPVQTAVSRYRAAAAPADPATHAASGRGARQSRGSLDWLPGAWTRSRSRWASLPEASTGPRSSCLSQALR